MNYQNNTIKKIIQVSMITSFVFVVSLFLSTVSTFAATPACGSTITTDTTLDSDMSCPVSNSAAITVGADNITLDCAGYNIVGSGTEGINATHRSNIIVKNCKINGLSPVIRFEYVSNSVITNNILISPHSGLLDYNGNNNTINSNTIEGYWGGITINGGSNYTITNNVITSMDGYALNLSGVNMLVSGNTLKDVHSNLPYVGDIVTALSLSVDTPVLLLGVLTDLKLDTDGDGVPDFADACPLVKGTIKDGCPYIVNTNVNMHVLSFQQDGGSSCPDGSSDCIVPAEYGGQVWIFDRDSQEFQSSNKNLSIMLGKKIDPKNPEYFFYSYLRDIANGGDYGWGTSTGLVGTCQFDGSNPTSCSIALDRIGNYLFLSNEWGFSTFGSSLISSKNFKEGVANVGLTSNRIVDSAGNSGPVADKITMDIQVIDQQKSGVCGYDNKGKAKDSCKMPIVGAVVRVFDMQDPSFVSTYGSNPSKMMSDQIYENGLASVGPECTTNEIGTCYASDAYPGRFMVVGKWTDPATGKSVYTSKIKDFKNDVVSATRAEEDDVAMDKPEKSGIILNKNLHIIKTIKKDGSVKYEAGKMTVVSGSQLDILYPEYTIWDGTAELYPFVMTSDSNWTVDVCLQVPTGYSIKGVQDVDGNIIGTSNCAQALVAGQPAVVLFSLADIGSPEPSMGLSITTTHNGKKAKQDVTIDGIRKKTKDLQDKDLKVKVKINKQKADDLHEKVRDIQDKLLKDKQDKQDKLIKTKTDQKKTDFNEQQALLGGGSVWSRIGSFFSGIGSNIARYATIFTAFLFK